VCNVGLLDLSLSILNLLTRNCNREPFRRSGICDILSTDDFYKYSYVVRRIIENKNIRYVLLLEVVLESLKNTVKSLSFRTASSFICPTLEHLKCE
jgi:hypothetical protein